MKTEWNYHRAIRNLGAVEVPWKPNFFAFLSGVVAETYPTTPPKIALAPVVKNGKFCTIAHELAHVALGHFKIPPQTLPPGRLIAMELLAEKTSEYVCNLIGHPYYSESSYPRQAEEFGDYAWRYIREHDVEAHNAARRIVEAGMPEVHS